MKATRILVVDDDADVRTSVAEALEDEGYEVHGASNGRDALSHLQGVKEPPDLILLDMMMPIMDGRTFRVEQQKSPCFSAIPVLIFSAYNLPRETAAELRVEGVLRKPLRLDDLLANVERVVRRGP